MFFFGWSSSPVSYISDNAGTGPFFVIFLQNTKYTIHCMVRPGQFFPYSHPALINIYTFLRVGEVVPKFKNTVSCNAVSSGAKI